jgi:hypothetical protein
MRTGIRQKNQEKPRLLNILIFYCHHEGGHDERLDQIGDPQGDIMDDLVWDTLSGFGLQSKVQRIVDVVYNDELSLRGQGDLTGKQLQVTYPGDLSDNCAQRLQPEAFFLAPRNRRVDMGGGVPPAQINLTAAVEDAEPGRSCIKDHLLDERLDQVLVIRVLLAGSQDFIPGGSMLYHAFAPAPMSRFDGKTISKRA